MVLSADGFIVTNNHVVATAQGSTVTVIFADGKKASAKIVGTDPRTDLAVVKADRGQRPARPPRSAAAPRWRSATPCWRSAARSAWRAR